MSVQSNNFYGHFSIINLYLICRNIILHFPQSYLSFLFPCSSLSVGINHQYYIIKPALLMVNTAYIVSYSSSRSTLTLLLCWKVSFINLVLKAKSLLTLSECSSHMTGPLTAIPLSIKQSSDSKCFPEELCFHSSFPRFYYYSFFKILLQSIQLEIHQCSRREWHRLPAFRKNFSMQLKKKFLFPLSSSPLMSPLNRHGQWRQVKAGGGGGRKLQKFSSPVLLS